MPLPCSVAVALAVAAFALPSTALAAQGDISTVAGTGVAGFSGDGGQAPLGRLSLPISVAALSDGGWVIADQANNRVRRVAPDGTLSTIAGNGTAGFSGNGGPALSAQLSAPSGVLELPDGSILVSDANNNQVRRIANGAITAFAGTGAAAFGGDGGPATSAQVRFPYGLALRADGSVLITDIDNGRIRQVSPGGTITTVAGGGAGGDGGPATNALLAKPFDVSVTSDGGFLVAEADARRVRRVTAGGTISTVAGSGGSGSAGDGGPATSATFGMPTGVEALPGGGFLVADRSANRVRQVSPGGTIGAFAGTGTAGSGGDGAPAVAANLNGPHGMTLLGDGDPLIAETFGHRVRRVDLGDPAPPGPPAPSRAPGVAGVPSPGQTLTCVPGAFTNEPVTRSYVWELAPRGTTASDDPAWQVVAGQTATTYAVREADLAFAVRCREVAVNGAGTATAASRGLRVDRDVPAPRPQGARPAIEGLAVVGRTVACLHGDWDNPGDFAITWIADDANVSSGREFVVPPGIRGRTLRCRVTGSNDVGAGGAAESTGAKVVQGRPTRPLPVGLQLVSTGARPFDKKAVCDPATWTDDEGRYTFSWFRDDEPIAGETGPEYQVTVADLGRVLTCRVVSTNALGDSGQVPSRRALVPLPNEGTEAKIFAAVNGQNWLSPTSMVAVSAHQLDVLRPALTQRFNIARSALATTCFRDWTIARGRPGGEDTVVAQPKFDLRFGRRLTSRETCWVLIFAQGAVATTPDGVFWRPQDCSTAVAVTHSTEPVPRGQPRPAGPARETLGVPYCPRLRIEIPENAPAEARERDAAVDPAFTALAPREVLWDLDGNGRVDATCGADGPVLRTLPNRGRYPRLRAVLVLPDSAETGVFAVATKDFDFSFGNGQEGSLRSAQPFACRTSISVPPSPNLPCVTRSTFGGVRLQGNLCPVATRDVPAGELGALDDDVRTAIESKALKDAEAQTASARAARVAFTDHVLLQAANPLQGRRPTVDGAGSAGSVAQNIVATSDPPLTIGPKLKADADYRSLFTESFLEHRAFAADQIYVARGPVKVNGVELAPGGAGARAAQSGAPATILVPSDVGAAIPDVKQLAVSSSKARLRMLAPNGDELPLSNPEPFKAKVTDEIRRETDKAKSEAKTFARKNLNALADNLKSKLDIGPFKFADGSTVKLEDDGTASILASAKLDLFKDPESQQALSAKVEIKADQSGKLTLRTIHITAGRVLLGPLEINGVDIRYDDNGLTVKGKIILTPNREGVEITTFRITDSGRFAGLGLKYLAGAGSGIPVGPGVFLTQIGGEFQNPPPGLDLAAARISAFAALSAGQSVGSGCPAAGLIGELQLNWSPGKFALDATGEPTIACVKVGKVTFHADSDGFVELRGNASVNAGPIRGGGEIRGQLDLKPTFKDSRFQLEMSADGEIADVVTARIATILSNVGLAACGSMKIAKIKLLKSVFGKTVTIEVAGGAGVRFINGLPPLTLPQLIAGIDIFAGCDLSDYKTFARARAAQSGGGRILPVDRGERLLSLNLVGRGGVPKVRLTTPDGRVLDYTNVPERLTAMPDGSSAMAIPAKDRLVILIAEPQAGNWKVEPAEGSPGLADLQTARALPRPRVRARVSGRGARRVLRWTVAPQAGQQVTLSEVGRDSNQTLATITRGRHGEVRYVTGGSGGPKRIVASIVQDGLPRATLDVARYTSPRPRVGRPGRVRVRRIGRGRVRITWRASPLAQRYLVGLTYTGGRRASFRPRGAARSLTVSRADSAGLRAVRVRGERTGAPLGRPAHARLRR